MEFEEAYDELKNINERLEKNQVKLEKSLELYQRGTDLIHLCRKKLKGAEGEIKTLKENMDIEELDEMEI